MIDRWEFEMLMESLDEDLDRLSERYADRKMTAEDYDREVEKIEAIMLNLQQEYFTQTS